MVSSLQFVICEKALPSLPIGFEKDAWKPDFVTVHSPLGLSLSRPANIMHETSSELRKHSRTSSCCA